MTFSAAPSGMPGGVMFFQTPASSTGAVAGRSLLIVPVHLSEGAPLPASGFPIATEPAPPPAPPVAAVPACPPVPCTLTPPLPACTPPPLPACTLPPPLPVGTLVPALPA